MTAQLGHEFDAFLFASVDQETDGGSLSVLSVLARANVDPWREAADLAGMPLEAANRRLTSLIGALPPESAVPLVPAAIADRLVRLLPRGTSASVASRGQSLQTDPALHSRTFQHAPDCRARDGRCAVRSMGLSGSPPPHTKAWLAQRYLVRSPSKPRDWITAFNDYYSAFHTRG